jgi:hypothetical protein
LILKEIEMIAILIMFAVLMVWGALAAAPGAAPALG